MKNKFFRRAAVLTAALFSFTCMSATAYAQSNEPVAETEPPAAEETTTKPFTPDGTGTVVDNATDEDGKEFFTITTPSENVFYQALHHQLVAGAKAVKLAHEKYPKFQMGNMICYLT